MKNRAIEIHDSTLEAISVRDGAAVLHFPCVYIHESMGTPGVDAGRGWVQQALLRIRDAAVTRSFSKFPADLLDGHIKLGDAVLRNEIPIPLSHKGIVELRLESCNDEVVLITGSSAELELIGEPKYVEEFRPWPGCRALVVFQGGFSDRRFSPSRWPIPMCPFLARAMFRVEEKPAPFKKSVKSAAP